MRFIISILLAALLTGCATGPRTAVKGVFRSCNTYKVRGSYYEPQKFYEYCETGLASWYGPGFHGRPKAFGERFNQWGISAAHRTLPLPTVVKVTNLENGKTLKLIVDDRGPYTYRGRIIDLSIGASKVLGTYSKGIARVKVESIVDESKALSQYLQRYGRNGYPTDGRSWQQIYRDEIAGKFGDNTSIGHIKKRHKKHLKKLKKRKKNAQKKLKKAKKRKLSKKYVKNNISRKKKAKIKNNQKEIDLEDLLMIAQNQQKKPSSKVALKKINKKTTSKKSTKILSNVKNSKHLKKSSEKKPKTYKNKRHKLSKKINKGQPRVELVQRKKSRKYKIVTKKATSKSIAKRFRSKKPSKFKK